MDTGADSVASVASGSGGATGEVLVCAGAVNTPQLLMLSGIGPRTELEKHGIRVVVDLPGVGANLADHPAVVSGYRITKPISITDEMFLAGGVLSPARVGEWLVRGSGPVATTGEDYCAGLSCAVLS